MKLLTLRQIFLFMIGKYINKGVSVMRDYDPKLEDLKASHTLGGLGEGDTQGEGRGLEARGLRV
jgi:hypothetical protein